MLAISAPEKANSKGRQQACLLTIEMARGVGGLPGLSEGGCGDGGEASACVQTRAKTVKRFGEIRNNLESDGSNVEVHMKELSVVPMDLTKACWRMLEQEHLRFIAMFLATRSSGRE